MKIVNKITLLFFAAATAAAPLHGGLGLRGVYHKLIGYHEPTFTEKLYTGTLELVRKYPPQKILDDTLATAKFAVATGYAKTVDLIKKYPTKNLVNPLATAGLVATAGYAGGMTGYKVYQWYRWYQHRPPAELRNLIEQHKQIILEEINKQHGRTQVISIKEIPGFYIKTDISRLENAEAMRDYIHQNSLDRFDVAKKYLYHLDGTPLIFAEKISRDGNILPLSTQERQQKKLLTEGTSYWDWHFDNHYEDNYRPNWIRSNSKLVCIDTENISFQINWWKNPYLKKHGYRSLVGAGVGATIGGTVGFFTAQTIKNNLPAIKNVTLVFFGSAQ